MEFLKAIFFAGIIFIGLISRAESMLPVNGSEYRQTIESNLALENNESIIEQDDIVFISANDNITKVDFILMSDGSKSTVTGCYQLNCNIDVSSYVEGNYQVDVTTTKGEFSDMIVISH